MKKYLLLPFVFMVCILYPGAVFSQSTSSAANDYIIAYYFHGNMRCRSCNILEQYSRQAIEDNFQDEIASNRLIFKIVNVQETANDHFMKDYGLYSQSLVLSFVRDGKEERFKNLTMIWQYARDRQRLTSYVKDEINAYLKELL
jgi:hypothetical protein